MEMNNATSISPPGKGMYREAAQEVLTCPTALLLRSTAAGGSLSGGFC